MPSSSPRSGAALSSAPPGAADAEAALSGGPRAGNLVAPAPASAGQHPSARGDLLAGTGGYLTAAVLWGLNLPLTATLLQTFDPFWVSPLRYLIATVLLGGLLALTQGLRDWRSPIALHRVAFLSLFVAGFLMLYNLGLAHADAMTVAALSAGSPVYVAVVSRFMTGARLQRGFWGATLLTLIGAGIAVFGRAKASGGNLGLQGGEPLIILSIASWTAYSILAQRWFTPDVSQLRRTYLSTVGAVPWLLAFWGLARLTGLAPAPNWSPGTVAVLQLFLAAVLCTATATVAWNIGVSRLGIQMGGVWQNLVPVFAVILATLLFGFEPLREQIIGGAIVLMGVLYMQWQRWRA